MLIECNVPYGILGAAYNEKWDTVPSAVWTPRLWSGSQQPQGGKVGLYVTSSHFLSQGEQWSDPRVTGEHLCQEEMPGSTLHLNSSLCTPLRVLQPLDLAFRWWKERVWEMFALAWWEFQIALIFWVLYLALLIEKVHYHSKPWLGYLETSIESCMKTPRIIQFFF